MSAGIAVLPLVGDDRLRTATVDGARWLRSVQLWRPDDPDALTTGDVETAVLLLAGTFDLAANSTTWPARGARTDAMQGRPMAVFLPKNTGFRVGNGHGEILLLAASQPTGEVAATGRAALAQKPLLPMAGSGKSFDPTSGEWKPAETFPTAPESLPPRRFERIVVGDCTIERVFGKDYKARTLSVDEVVLQPGRQLRLGDIPGRANCDEVLLFVRSEGEAVLDHGAGRTQLTGDGVVVISKAAFETCTVRAVDRRCYVAIAYAGKLPASGS